MSDSKIRTEPAGEDPFLLLELPSNLQSIADRCRADIELQMEKRLAPYRTKPTMKTLSTILD